MIALWEEGPRVVGSVVQRRHGMKAVASEAARASWVISADASPSASYNVKSGTCLREQHVEDLIRVIIGTRDRLSPVC